MPYTLSLGDQHHPPQPYLAFERPEQMARCVLRVLAMLEREGVADAVLCVCGKRTTSPAPSASDSLAQASLRPWWRRLLAWV